MAWERVSEEEAAIVEVAKSLSRKVEREWEREVGNGFEWLVLGVYIREYI